MRNLRKLFILSVKDLKSHEWLNIKIILTLSCLMFLISLLFIFTISLRMTQNNYKQNYISANYILSPEVLKIDESEKTEVSKLKLYDFSSLFIDYNEEIKFPENYYYSFSYSSLKLKVDDDVYTCLLNFNPVINYGAGMLHIFATNHHDHLFNSNDYAEANRKFGLHNFVIGEMPQQDNEILLSGDMVKRYGLDIDKVLDHKITCLFRDRMLFEPVIVTGIIRQEYYDLCGHSNSYYGLFVPTIIMREGNQLFQNTDNVLERYLYAFNEWTNSYDINGRYYAGQQIIKNIELITKIDSVLGSIFVVVGSAIGVGIFFIIYLIMGKLIEIFMRNGGIMQLFGLQKREFHLIILIKLLILCSFAAIFSIIITNLAYYILIAIISKYFAVNFLNTGIMLFVICFAVCLFIAIFTAGILFVNSSYLIKNKSVKEMLEAKTV